jgi:hypothetical protein
MRARVGWTQVSRKLLTFRAARRMPEEIPEGCLIGVCLRNKAVVGVYKYEC